jgi:hypothetical protein
MRTVAPLLCLSIAVLAQPADNIDPFVKKIVDALAGQWTLQGTDREPGAQKPAEVRMKFDCRPAALGTAVACHLSGDVGGLGPVEAATIIGYNPDEHLVHWMEISSTSEYHDHKGVWNGDTIDFEPLVYTAMGKKSTEKFTLRFPSKGKMVLMSTTETEGSVSQIDGTATRQSATRPSASKP